MPRWLILPLYLFALTLVVPVFVWGNTSGNWRAALRAWWSFGKYLAALSALGALTALGYWAWPPIV